MTPAPRQPDFDGRHPCPRGRHCSSSVRDESGEWHPALVNSAFCPADETAIAKAIPDLPRSYALLSARIGDPVRRGKGIRRPPGSRVLLNPDADALLRTASAQLMGWAARVRAVPGLKLSPNRHLPDKPEGFRDNCGVLVRDRHFSVLLALPLAPTARTWTWLPDSGSTRPEPAPCRRCGLPVVPAPSGRRWWPAVCSHPRALAAAWEEKPDGTRVPSRLACAACSARLPAGWTAPAACEHVPSAAVAGRPGGVPPEIEEEIAGLEIVRIGDGWVTCLDDLSGVNAGLEILDLQARFRRMLGENPAPPDLLDGIPCPFCDAMASLEVVPQLPPDPSKPEPLFCRCTSCRAEMTRKEYDREVSRYESYVRGGSVRTCRRCDLGYCREDPRACQWEACACRASGHRKAA